MKKIIIPIIIAMSCIQPVFVLAGSPTADVANSGTHAANLGTNANTTAQQVLKTLKDYGLDQIAYMLAQKLGKKMATMAINKTTGGASSDKDPNFVKDFGKVLTDIDQQQRDLYTTKLLANTTNPYAKTIAKTMLQQANTDGLSKFTLGNFLANGADYEAVGKDLSGAGDKGLLFYSQLAEPSNTPVGAGMIAQNQLSQEIERKKQSQTLKINSSGFLPQAKCTSTIADYKKNVATITTGSNSIDAANASISSSKAALEEARAAQTQAIATYGDNSPEADAADAAFYAAQTQLDQSIAQQQGIIANTGINIGGAGQTMATDTAGCIEEMIQNPVSAVTTITADAGKFGMDMTKNIQGWGQIVAGVFVSLFNGFINTGLSSLKADYGKVKQTDTGGPEQLYQKTASGGLTTNTNFAKSPNNIIDLRNDFETSIKATTENIDILKKAQEQLFKFPARLATLDMCLPGPDRIGLKSRLNDYWDQQIGWIQKSSMMGDDKKRNAYQEIIMSILERDYDIAKAEMSLDMNDDTKNIPGANTMRNMIDSFQKRKAALENTNSELITANDALSQLRQINVGLKQNIAYLKGLSVGATPKEPDFAFLNNVTIVFTTDEWAHLSQADKDASYAWAVANSGTAPVADPAISTDANHGKFVIKTSWDLWEYPFKFLPGNKWHDDVSGVSADEDAFLAEKNQVRSSFNAIKNVIPSDYEISKNAQARDSYIADIKKTDDLISDCDQMRKLIWGTTAVEGVDGWFTTNPGSQNSDFLAYLIANKDTLFKSDDVKNTLGLPSILTSTATWADDGCRPNADVVYEAVDSSGRNFGDHGGFAGGEYSCYGNFGHLFGVNEKESDNYDFDKWLDSASNIYSSQTHIVGPGELYWKSAVRAFNPPPNPDTYNKGWSITTLKETSQSVDGGNGRGLFCRFSSVLADYGRRSGADIPRPSKNIVCSSKWADVSISEAIGLFLVDQLN